MNVSLNRTVRSGVTALLTVSMPLMISPIIASSATGVTSPEPFGFCPGNTLLWRRQQLLGKSANRWRDDVTGRLFAVAG